jgi:hypothetical protein
MTDPNRRFHELAGLCWHEIINSLEHPTEQRVLYQCSCFEETEDIQKHLSKYPNPDYADPRLVLEVIARLPYPRMREFLSWLGRNGTSVPVEYIVNEGGSLEQTGKLRDKAIEWMEACR